MRNILLPIGAILAALLLFGLFVSFAGVDPVEVWVLLFKGAFGDTIGDLKETAQGYKTMFDSASQQVNSTLRDATKFDHDAPNLPTEVPEAEVEPKFVPFEIGLPETDSEADK